MTSDRIKEIQLQTAYPESVSVKQALLQVWNECEQEKAKRNLPIWKCKCGKFETDDFNSWYVHSDSCNGDAK